MLQKIQLGVYIPCNIAIANLVTLSVMGASHCCFMLAYFGRLESFFALCFVCCINNLPVDQSQGKTIEIRAYQLPKVQLRVYQLQKVPKRKSKVEDFFVAHSHQPSLRALAPPQSTTTGNYQKWASYPWRITSPFHIDPSSPQCVHNKAKTKGVNKQSIQPIISRSLLC